MIHNAPFDIGFLNAEFSRCGHPPLSMERVIDTLPLARQKYPGAQASLDALCRSFDIDNSQRDFHGALIDADLLASVFVELKGGRQPGLKLEDEIENESSNNNIFGEDKEAADSNLSKTTAKKQKKKKGNNVIAGLNDDDLKGVLNARKILFDSDWNREKLLQVVNGTHLHARGDNQGKMLKELKFY